LQGYTHTFFDLHLAGTSDVAVENHDAASIDEKWTFSPTKLPTVWFGANSSGPENPEQHRDEAQYRSVYFGWQQGNTASGCKNEEDALKSQISAVKSISQKIVTTAYGANAQAAEPFYAWQDVALSNPSLSGFFLKGSQSANDGVRSRHLIGDCPLPTTTTWDFRNKSARDFFVENVIKPWASFQDADAVFIDEGDSIQCRGHSALSTLEDIYEYSNGTVEVYRRAAAVLAAAGKRLVLSLKNGISGASPIAVKIGICAVPLEKVIAAMQMPPAAPWLRYHEYFSAFVPLDDKAPSEDGTAMCQNLVATSIFETQHAGVGISVHGGNYTATETLELSFALFMIVRNAEPGQHEDWFGWSSGPDFWHDRDWSWNTTAPLYSTQWGKAITPTITVSPGVYKRGYEGGNFEVDCHSLKATITRK